MTKMQKSKELFLLIHSDEYIITEKTQRKEFIKKAIIEIGMTQAGASTYYQNLRNLFINSKSLYEYNNQPKKQQDVYVPEFRWLIVVEGKVVDSQPSRDKARQIAKILNGIVKDSTK